MCGRKHTRDDDAEKTEEQRSDRVRAAGDAIAALDGASVAALASRELGRGGGGKDGERRGREEDGGLELHCARGRE
jgi:hypothetical protein